MVAMLSLNVQNNLFNRLMEIIYLSYLQFFSINKYVYGYGFVAYENT